MGIFCWNLTTSLVILEVLSRRGTRSCLFNQDSQSKLIPYRSDCLGVDSFTSGWPVHSESWQSPPKHIGSFSLRVGHGTLSGIMAPDKKNCLDYRRSVEFQNGFYSIYYSNSIAYREYLSYMGIDCLFIYCCATYLAIYVYIEPINFDYFNWTYLSGLLPLTILTAAILLVYLFWRYIFYYGVEHINSLQSNVPDEDWSFSSGVSGFIPFFCKCPYEQVSLVIRTNCHFHSTYIQLLRIIQRILFSLIDRHRHWYDLVNTMKKADRD